MSKLPDFFDNLDDQKIEDYKEKINKSIKIYIDRLSELINDIDNLNDKYNILLNSHIETTEELKLNKVKKNELESQLISNNYKTEEQFEEFKKTEKELYDTNIKTKKLTEEKNLLEDKLNIISIEKNNLENNIRELKNNNDKHEQIIEELKKKILIFENESSLNKKEKEICEDLKKKLEEKKEILIEKDKILIKLKSVTDLLDTELNDDTDDVTIIKKEKRIQRSNLLQKPVIRQELPELTEVAQQLVQLQQKKLEKISEQKSEQKSEKEILEEINKNIKDETKQSVEMKRIINYINGDETKRKDLNGINYVIMQLKNIKKNKSFGKDSNFFTSPCGKKDAHGNLKDNDDNILYCNLNKNLEELEELEELKKLKK